MGISTDFIKQRLLERAKSDSSISVARIFLKKISKCSKQNSKWN